MTSPKSYDGSCFCGAVQFTVTGEAGQHGLLSLQLPPLVGGSGECLHLVAAGKCENYPGKRNLGTFSTRTAAEKHERAVQFYKRH